MQACERYTQTYNLINALKCIVTNNRQNFYLPQFFKHVDVGSFSLMYEEVFNTGFRETRTFSLTTLNFS